jgi:hypothetical protein
MRIVKKCYYIFMRKISRRLFLWVMLTACSPLPSKLLSDTTPPVPAVSNQSDQVSIVQIPIEYIPSFVPPTPAPTQRAAADTQGDRVVVDVEPAEEVSAKINEVIIDRDTFCHIPVAVPKLPAVIPAPGEIDVNTGRHMMGTVQVLDVASYRLEVTGLVDHPLVLTYDDLLCMPKMTEMVTTTCYSFSDTAIWSGVAISEVLKKAGVQSGATKVIQKAPDVAGRAVTMEMAMDPHNFLAYRMGDRPLPVLFGFPVRSIFIDVAGQYSVKWLTALEVI